MKLKKVVNVKTAGEYVTTKQHVIKTELDKKFSDLILDMIDYNDDPESQFHSYGISTDFDGEIVCIDMDRLSTQLKYEIANPDEDDTNMEDHKLLTEFLDKYEGYTLWW